MASETQNGHNTEDEDFQKHIQQMLSNGPGIGTSTTGASQQSMATTTTTTSDVDLNYTSPGSGLSTSRSVDESPFGQPGRSSLPSAV